MNKKFIWYPRYDILDRKIYSNKKEGLVYWHELRHKHQHQKDWFTVAYRVVWMFVLLFAFLSIFLGNNIYKYFVWVVILIEVIIEVDAWIYSIKRHFNKH